MYDQSYEWVSGRDWEATTAGRLEETRKRCIANPSVQDSNEHNPAMVIYPSDWADVLAFQMDIACIGTNAFPRGLKII